MTQNWTSVVKSNWIFFKFYLLIYIYIYICQSMNIINFVQSHQSSPCGIIDNTFQSTIYSKSLAL